MAPAFIRRSYVAPRLLGKVGHARTSRLSSDDKGKLGNPLSRFLFLFGPIKVRINHEEKEEKKKKFTVTLS